MLDARGKLVGINTHMRVDSQGLGFAIPSAHVVDFLSDFYGRRDAGDIVIPSDEQLAQLEQSLSPLELFEAAAELVELTILKNESTQINNWCWDVVTNSGNMFFAVITGENFGIWRHIAKLDKSDENILLQILRWQNKVTFCRFEINDENELFLGYRRPFQDLDISEAGMALWEMAGAVDAWLEPLEGYFQQ